MNNEKLFMFNPFKIEEISDEEIAKEYHTLQQALLDVCETPYEYANNIELYANMNYLIGEMIARYNYSYTSLKNQISIKESQLVCEARKQWVSENTGKTPAITYFEAIATANLKEEIKELAICESRLKRFKNAFQSVEEKMNALKKSLEATKYEL